MSTKKEKFLIMKDGTKHKVIKETGKFYITARAQFRKSNPTIIQTEKITKPEEKELVE